jgi:ankyrin repeat protein
MTDDSTALHTASNNGHVEVVRELLQNKKVDATLKDKEGLTARDMADRARNCSVLEVFDNHSKDVEEVNKNRKLLAEAMTTTKAVPVELSFQYVNSCITNHKLGSGAFGDVFLAQDSDLPKRKKFAVKKIKLSQSSPGPDGKNLECFHSELSVRSIFCFECCIVLNNEP